MLIQYHFGPQGTEGKLSDGNVKKDYQRNMKLAASLYGDYQDELLTREEYLQLKKQYSSRCTELES